MIEKTSAEIRGSPSKDLIPGELATMSTWDIARPLPNSDEAPSLRIITLSSFPVLEIVELRPSAIANKETITATEPAIPTTITIEDPDLCNMFLRFISVIENTCLRNFILIHP